MFAILLRMEHVKTSTLVVLAIVLTIVAALLLQIRSHIVRPTQQTITNFEQCAAAGNPIMESYPRQCRANGQTFVEETSAPSSSDETSYNGCAVAGCSGQLCVEESEAANIVTDCEYRPEFGCYEDAHCGRQINGHCGWTETAQLKQCLNSPPKDNVN